MKLILRLPLDKYIESFPTLWAVTSQYFNFQFLQTLDCFHPFLAHYPSRISANSHFTSLLIPKSAPGPGLHAFYSINPTNSTKPCEVFGCLTILRRYLRARAANAIGKALRNPYVYSWTSFQSPRRESFSQFNFLWKIYTITHRGLKGNIISFPSQSAFVYKPVFENILEINRVILRARQDKSTSNRIFINLPEVAELEDVFHTRICFGINLVIARINYDYIAMSKTSLFVFIPADRSPRCGSGKTKTTKKKKQLTLILPDLQHVERYQHASDKDYHKSHICVTFDICYWMVFRIFYIPALFTVVWESFLGSHKPPKDLRAVL